MKTRSTILTTLTAAGVLSAGFALGTAGGHTTANSTTPPSGPQRSTASDPSPQGSPTPGSDEQASNVYTGEAVTHRHGSVTVSVTVTDGVVTDAKAAYEATSSKSVDIAEGAIPTLNANVVAANGAEIDTVSGATYTSEAYLTSLQSALDQVRS